MKATLCDTNSPNCALGGCKTCNTFSKIDQLNIDKLKCSKICIQNNDNCQNHKVKVKKIEHDNHKGIEKKRFL